MVLPDTDPDIERARWLPPAFYADPEAHALAREKVFARAWHLVFPGPGEPGSLVPVTLLPGLLDESLLWATDKRGRSRLLSNACTHRGAILCDSPRRAVAGLACPYHGRVFGLDGRCREHGGMGREPEPTWNLPELDAPRALRALGPLHFARLPVEHPSATWPEPAFLGELQRRVGFLLAEPHRDDPEGARVYEVEANWALYVENYLEGFHLRWVHPGLSRQVEAESYAYELFPGGSLQVASGQDGAGDVALPAGHPDAGRRVAAWYFHLFPATFLNVYRWGVSVNVVEPLGPTRCRVRYRRLVRDATALGEGPGAQLHEVELEDDRIVASVAQGYRSRLATRGRYSLVHERAVHHFHRMYIEALGSA
ncbi:MAG: Rieske 2Fe-2S domain-containing protein [Deltaproteobacteria bacterium]|nr:Rieske 2Fe-2S domain-containing protein [Deltaproteobacteria bacterium]